MNCDEVDNQRFLEHARGIRLHWKHNFDDTDTRTKECVILTIEDWREFSESSFLPWYKSGLKYTDLDRVNYSLYEYAARYPSTLDPDQEMRILTAFHTEVRKRLIVDGCHRAVALETEVSKNNTIPIVTVLECFGSNVDRIFPCDFSPALMGQPTKVDNNKNGKPSRKPTQT